MTTDTLPESRAKFEAWVKDLYLGCANTQWDEIRNCYQHFETHLMWKAWQAAQAIESRDAQRWIPVSERLPPCDGETVFVGVNENCYACCFNALDSRGQCVMESPEDSVTHMSGLSKWMPLP